MIKRIVPLTLSVWCMSSVSMQDNIIVADKSVILHFAIQSDDEVLVRRLLQRRSDVCGHDTLMYAIALGRLEIARLLMNHGASINPKLTKKMIALARKTNAEFAQELTAYIKKVS